jgi:hypothetical protein
MAQASISAGAISKANTMAQEDGKASFTARIVADRAGPTRSVD